MSHAIFIKATLLLITGLHAELKVDDFKNQPLDSKSQMQGLPSQEAIPPEMEKQLKDALGDLQKKQDESQKLFQELEKDM